MKKGEGDAKREVKSAYELIMERLGELKQLTEEQKTKIAEIDRIYEAKKAEVELRGEEELKRLVDNPEKQEEVRRRIAMEIERLEQKKRVEKDKVRGET